MLHEFDGRAVSSFMENFSIFGDGPPAPTDGVKREFVIG